MTVTRTALFWSFAERYSGLLISIGSTVVLARLLTPAQVGIYSMCAAVTAVAGILRDFGVTEYLIQERNLTQDKIRAAFGIAIVIAWTIGLGIFLARHELALFYGDSGVADILSVLVINFFLLPFCSPAFALLSREMAFRQLFKIQICSNLAQAVVSVTLAATGHGFMSLAWGPIANVGVQSLILLWLRPRESAFLPGLRGAREVLRFGSMFVSSRAVEVLTRNFHEPVIAKTFDFASVGLFSRAWGLIDLFHLNIAAAVVRVSTPAFAAEHRAGKSVIESFSKATSIFTSISWPSFFFIALTASEIISIMFGGQWASAAPLASILAIAALPTGIYTIVPQMLSAVGHVKRRMIVTLLASPVHLVGVLLASTIGLRAVAAVWLVTNTVTLILYTRELRDLLGMSPRVLLQACRPSLIVTLASVGAQIVILATCRWLGAYALVSLSLTLLVGALAWLAAAASIDHPAYREATKLFSAFRSRLGVGAQR